MKKKILSLCLVLALGATAVLGGTLAYFTDTTEQQTNTFTVGNVNIKLDEAKIGTTTNERTEEDQEFGVIMPDKYFAKDPTITIEEGSQDCYAFLQLDMNKYVSLINLMGVDAYHNKIGGLQGGAAAYPGFKQFVADLMSNKDLRIAVVDRWFDGIDHPYWQIMNADEIAAMLQTIDNQGNPSTMSLVLGYIGPESENGKVQAGDFFKFMDGFQMPGSVTEEMFDGDLAYYINGASKSNFNTDAAKFKMSFTAHAIQAAEIDTIEEAYTAYFTQN